MLARILMSCFAVLLLAAQAFAGDIAIDKTDTDAWPLLKVEYLGAQPSADNVYMTVPGIERRIQAKKSQKSQEIQMQNLLVAVDTSKSLTNEYLDAIKVTLKDYINHVSDNCRMAVLSFNNATHLHTPFTKNKKQLLDSLDLIKQGGTKTELYGTIDSSIALLQKNEGARTMLLVTDGHHDGAARDIQALIKKAADNGVVIHVIGLPDKKAKNVDYLSNMRKIAAGTNGAYEFCATPIALSSAVITVLNRKDIEPVYRNSVVFDLSDVSFEKAGDTECVLTEESGKSTSATRFTIGVPESAANKLFGFKPVYVYAAIACGAVLLILLAVLLLRRKEPEISMPPVIEEEKETDSSFVIEFLSLGMSFPLPYGRVTVGSSSDNSIVLGNPTVSRHHAVLEVTREGVRISDLKSTNGIYVNKERITRPVYLKPGDRLYFGNAEALIRQIGSANQ